MMTEEAGPARSAKAPRSKPRPVHGWVVLDKPLGITSTRALSIVRRVLNAEKGGHAGTLDPLAEGILPLAFGEATKTIPYLVDARKTYQFTVRWGEETTTDDREGAVAKESALRPGGKLILEALPTFIGTIMQTPPAFSAVKIDGERAYDLARSGEEVELAPRPVNIHRLELVDMPDPHHARFEMSCGKGTYVRAFARDLGRKLGCLGHLVHLRRTAVGPFGIKSAIPLAKIEECDRSALPKGLLLPVSTALDDIPALAVTDQEATLLRRGQAILARGRVPSGQVRANEGDPASGPWAVFCHSRAGDPVALTNFDKGELKPTRVFTFSKGV